MRVLHLGSGNIYGGIERALVLYAEGRNFARSLTPDFGVTFPGQLEAELREQGAEVAVLGPARLSRPWSVRAARRALSAYLARCKPAVVVTHGSWVHGVYGPAIKRSGIPLALFIHSPVGKHWLDEIAKCTRPALVIANSRFTRDQSLRWLGSIPSVVCTYPFRRPAMVDRQEERRKLGIPNDSIVVLQASRLDPYKGYGLHLRALAQIKEDETWRALFVGGEAPGSGKYTRYLIELRDRLGLGSRVDFLGHRGDIPALMAASDIFCQPNEAPEAFGISFVEAMLAGLPVIATKMGGAAEIFDSTVGNLVLPEPAALAMALRELIQNPRKREALAGKCRQLATMQYTMERGVTELARQLTPLVQCPEAPPEGPKWA